MSYDLDDTICAIGTAAGGAARGMVRISGPDAIATISRLFAANDGASLATVRLPTAIRGRATFRLDVDRDFSNDLQSGFDPNADLVRLPCDLFLWPGTRSYTRQPVAELHTVGSRPLLESLLAAVCRTGARLAEPGEFTLRAFLAGRIDLTQAEGVLGVIDARGEAELHAALAQLAGGLARPLRLLRDELLQLLAELEAGLDFVDEDIEFASSDELRTRLDSASRVLGDVARQMAMRHTSSGLPQVALLGPPNVGKSSLFNALVARCGLQSSRHALKPALVSAQRGTTRDYLTATLDLDGLQCELVDTAGVETETPPPAGTSSIRAAANAMTFERRDFATVRLCCIDESQDPQIGILEGSLGSSADMIVLTKADIALKRTGRFGDWSGDKPVVLTSSKTGEGLTTLLATIRSHVTNAATVELGQAVGATADRCRESIRLAIESLARARGLASVEDGHELIAAELRTALSELGKVVGAVYTDDLLDRIFSTFCIGK
jgi:tRNA modification GTPase